ncbi:hypothetical protein LTR97_009153 [Elasticomyces elasticus]|uniref:DUF4048 domain-containing protein n=1 Tax=Elasticomyces elasticus TaxID=574655 RepID=A0AAN7ZM09_9PEZI|nr:hypothetical protein LTR97_009153 [Elasticomyces elasticus]
MSNDVENSLAFKASMTARRKNTMEHIEVQSILTGSAMGAKPSPVEHVASPTSPRSSIRSHGRAASIAESTSSSATIRSNRFSTSFPVQPAGNGSGSPTRMLARSPTREAQPVIPESLASPTGPTDTNFLTAIAASERKVLELREELQRAEADLHKLKRQWTQHEANKKRNDARRVTKLEPLRTSLSTSEEKEEDASGSSAWMQQEMERRKALMGAGKPSNRTVFSGSRHTRTLSLLSPATDVRPKQTHPKRQQSLSRPTKRSTEHDRPPATRPTLLARASTTPDLTTEVAESADPGLDLSDNLDRAQMDPLIQQGKKIASDLSSGLWTFFEDLRQATVGDEATQSNGHYQPVHPAASVRRQGSVEARASRTSLRPTNKERSAAKTPSPARRHVKSMTQGALPDLANPSFFTEQAVGVVTTPVKTAKKSPTVRGHHTKGAPSKSASVTSTDLPWDTWDDMTNTKAPSSDSSGASSEATTLPSSTVSASPTSLMDQVLVPEKKDPIPWPALSKFGPATLRRTASHLMNEWERTLTPSPGKEFTGQEDYLGFSSSTGPGQGTEAAAMGGR